jgi:rubrerythrin
MEDKGELPWAGHLLSRTTLGDALRIALEFESEGFDLYTSLSRHLDSQVRPLILELANECHSHVNQLQDLDGRAELEQPIGQACAVRLRAEALRRAISLPHLPDEPIEDDVLNLAEIRERLAYDYYCCLARVPQPESIESLVLRFRDQKRRQGEEIRICCSGLFLIF